MAATALNPTKPTTIRLLEMAGGGGSGDGGLATRIGARQCPHSPAEGETDQPHSAQGTAATGHPFEGCALERFQGQRVRCP